MLFDPGYLCILNDDFLFTDMPTAIVRIHTSEGFILAADGREKSSLTQATNKDHEQKIFPIVNTGRTLAYALQGMAVLKDADKNSVIVDMATAVKESIESFTQLRSRDNLNWYASKISITVNQKLREQTRNLEGSPFPDVVQNDPGLIFQVFMCGYYRDKDSDLIIQFRHDNQKIVRPNIIGNRLESEPLCLFGSARVFDALFKRNDPRFQEFKTPMTTPDKRFNLTLLEAEEVAVNYIRACASDIGREIDPEVCSGIGGHIHVAEITPTNGFRWRIPPKQVAIATST
jgi:hypothetical protein